MAHPIMFNTLSYAKKLKAAGVAPAQAEIQAETQGEFFEYIASTNTKIDELKSDMDLKFARVDTKFAENRVDIIKWIVAIVAGQGALVVSALKFLH